jgi:hypothetical protein
MRQTNATTSTEVVPPEGHGDVRIVTPQQLQELRREQQAAYLSLRSKGLSPWDAAREVGIRHSLADEWERVPRASTRSGGKDPAVPGSASMTPDVSLPRVDADVIRRARACAVRVEQELGLLGRLLQHLERAQRPARARPRMQPQLRRAVRANLSDTLFGRRRTGTSRMDQEDARSRPFDAAP